MRYLTRAMPYQVGDFNFPYDHMAYVGGDYMGFSWPLLKYTKYELRDITGQDNGEADQQIIVAAPIAPVVNVQTPLNLTQPTTQSGSAGVVDSMVLPDLVASNTTRTYFSIQASSLNDETLYIGFGAPGNFELLAGMDLTPTDAWPQNSIWIRRSNSATGIGNYNIIQALAVNKPGK